MMAELIGRLSNFDRQKLDGLNSVDNFLQKHNYITRLEDNKLMY